MSRQEWGPYCPWPQDHTRYVHEIYPQGASGLIQEPGGAVREMTDEELDQLAEAHRDTLARYSFEGFT